MIKKIITHPRPHNLDDYLSVSLLKYLFPSPVVQYKQPYEINHYEIKDPKIILVDIGNSYDIELNNYDHHQDTLLPCSLILILKRFFPEVKISPAISMIDYTDRYSLLKAYQEGLLKRNYDIWLKSMVILKTSPSEKIGKVVLNLFEQDYLDYDGFITRLYDEIERNNPIQFQKAKDEMEKELREYHQKFQKIHFSSYYYKETTLRFSILTDTLYPFVSFYMEQTMVDIHIERNSRDHLRTTIFINWLSQNSEKAKEFIDFIISKLSFTILFSHDNGKLRVISENINHVKKQILELLSKVFI